MKITLAEARKLSKELKKKYPEQYHLIEIHFSSFKKECIQVYLSDSDFSSIKNYFNAEEIRQTFKL